MSRRRLILRYTLLQLPGYATLVLAFILAEQIVDFPEYAVWGVLGLWVVKDIALFPFVGRYYDPGINRDWFSMIGRQGVAQKPLTPTGTVRIKGELWKAELVNSDAPVDTGRPVVVRNVRGLTLQVAPRDNDH